MSNINNLLLMVYTICKQETLPVLILTIPKPSFFYSKFNYTLSAVLMPNNFDRDMLFPLILLHLKFIYIKYLYLLNRFT